MAGFKKSDGSYSIEKREDGKTYLTVPPSGTVYVTGGAFGANNAYAPVVYNDIENTVLNAAWAGPRGVPNVMGITSGYKTGGIHGYLTPPTAAPIAHPYTGPDATSTTDTGVKEIMSFPFTTSGTVTDVGDLVNYSNYSASINNRVDGYGFVGTQPYRSVENRLGPLNEPNLIPRYPYLPTMAVTTLDKVTFGNPATAADVGTLTGVFSFRGAASHSSSTKGYISGGTITEDGLNRYPYTFWGQWGANVNTSKTQSFTFASMPGGSATDVTELYSNPYQEARGFSSMEYGYVMGNIALTITDKHLYNVTSPTLDNPFYGPTVIGDYSHIKKFPFANESATAVSVGTYKSSIVNYQAISAKDKGYSIGKTDIVTPSPATSPYWQTAWGNIVPPYSTNIYPDLLSPEGEKLYVNESFSFVSDGDATTVGDLAWDGYQYPTQYYSNGPSSLEVLRSGSGVGATNDRGYMSGFVHGISLSTYTPINQHITWQDQDADIAHTPNQPTPAPVSPANPYYPSGSYGGSSPQVSNVTSFPFAIDGGAVSADIWDVAPAPRLTYHNGMLAS